VAYVAIDTGKEPGLRGVRARYLLETHERVTCEDMKAFVMDEYVIGCEPWHDLLLEAYDEFKDEIEDREGNVARVAERLRDWDRVASVHCKNMPFFYWWYVGLCGDGMSPEIDRASRDDRRRAAELFTEVVEGLVSEYGTTELKWGEIHVVRRGDREFPIGGCGVYFPTLHHARAKHEGHKVVVVAGQVYSAVVCFGDKLEAYTVLPFGQSGNPGSEHYADQAPLNGDRKLKRFLFDWREVMENARSQTELTYETKQPGQVL
jgi:hypothetical protein